MILDSGLVRLYFNLTCVSFYKLVEDVILCFPMATVRLCVSCLDRIYAEYYVMYWQVVNYVSNHLLVVVILYYMHLVLV